MKLEPGLYTVLGVSDYPVCGCCGKTNLKRSVILKHERSDEPINVGVICAAKLLRQRYGGKLTKLSTGAITSIGKAAGASPEWQARNGYGPSNFHLVVP